MCAEFFSQVTQVGGGRMIEVTLFHQHEFCGRRGAESSAID